LTVLQSARRTAPGGRAIAEGALLADLTVLVVLAGLYVPYASAILAAVAPIPLLLLVLRQGWRVSIQAFITASLLITFLTGPFTSFAVFTIAVRAFAIGIGLRNGWPVRKTLLAGTAFMWIIVWVGVTLAALAFPSWRAATEEGIAFTFRQGTAVLGVSLRVIGQGALWHRLNPRLDEFLAWFLKYWLLMLPLLVWPILWVACTAEYMIVEMIVPHFGIHPAPLRLPLLGSRADHGVRRPSRVRRRLEVVLRSRLQQRQATELRRSARRLTPAAARADSGISTRPVPEQSGDRARRDVGTASQYDEARFH
jgi:hypothetical protein